MNKASGPLDKINLKKNNWISKESNILIKNTSSYMISFSTENIKCVRFCNSNTDTTGLSVKEGSEYEKIW